MVSHSPKAKHSQIQYKICKHMQEAAGQVCSTNQNVLLRGFQIGKNMALKDREQ
jgi:hypothetical protein